MYNATLNGVPTDDPIFEALDIKWVYSNEDNLGNVVLTMDLKAKNKFVNEDESKYVFRIFTVSDNTTGYNITYKNDSTFLMPFSSIGNGTSIDINGNVSFIQDKGDEMMQITVSISKYLKNISHFSFDAYSMKVQNNATFLDYISELPGHPEYVNPELEESENLDTNEADDSKGTDDEGDSNFLWIAIIVIIIILFLLAILFWYAKKGNKLDESLHRHNKFPL